ncbi:MaoC/PaaZ C-terminal domain-containing protein [Lentibacillus sp. Marseille-P4043]|uniref:MaoC/PaaZ C-terminal domain-containing protein n=1 Tax=Lentibacillus sp. Marseille-P4043 TaxID=2040293 RepID=UPI000D0B9BB0|nr:MaoC/PaaZ C-terminal domain-containing protein [Lentibacillus sp. Marseille-P4043]
MLLKTELQYESLKVGQQLEPLTKPPVTKVQLVKYAGASGDFNPLHTDDEFAQKLGMNGVIAHGMLVMGFLGQYVQELAGNTAELSRFRMRFGAMTRPGDEITCSATVEKIYEERGKNYVGLDLKAEKSPGEVVGSGKAVLCFG